MKHELATNATNDTAFYLDGVAFVRKENALQVAAGTKSRVWRKKGEGLNLLRRAAKIWLVDVSYI